MSTINLTRAEAESMIEAIRKMLADGCAPATVEDMLRTVYRIGLLEKCSGDAHSNPCADNCGVCAPRWA